MVEPYNDILYVIIYDIDEPTKNMYQRGRCIDVFLFYNIAHIYYYHLLNLHIVGKRDHCHRSENLYDQRR